MTTYDKRLQKRRDSIDQAARLLRGLRQIAEGDLPLAVRILSYGWPMGDERARDVLTDTESFAEFLENIEYWVMRQGGSQGVRRRVARIRKNERRRKERANREGI